MVKGAFGGRWRGGPWVVVMVVGAVVLSTGPVWRPSTVDPVAAATSAAVGARTVALPTGDRLTVSTDAAGRTLVSPPAGSGPYVTEQVGGHHYVFPAAAAADRGAREGGRARYDVAPSAGAAGRGAASPRYPMRTVTLDVRDATGRPAATSWADLVNTDDSNRYARQTQITGGQARVSVPDGHYGGMVGQEAWNGSVLVAAWVVFVEFTVDGGATTVAADARTASPVSVSTPKPADLQTQDVIWYRGSGERGGFSDGYVGAPAGATFYVGGDPGGPGVQHFYVHDRLDSPAGSGDRYLYDVEFPQTGAIDAHHRYQVDPATLATLRARYYSPTGSGTGRQAWFSLLPWETFELRGSYPVAEPSERTEYLSTAPELAYHAWAATAGDSTAAVMDSGTYLYRPGQRVRLDWNAGPLASGLPADSGLDSYACPACREGDTISLDISPLTDTMPDHYGFPGSTKQDLISQRLRLDRDGTTLADLPGVHYGDVAVDPDPATYRATYDLSVTDPALPHPLGSHTTWTFRSGHSGATTVPARWSCGQAGTTDGCSPLPLLTAGYELPETLDGHVPTGLQPLRIALRHTPGAPPLPIRQVSLSVSDGGGWTTVPVVGLGDGVFQALLELPTTASGHVLALELSAVDEAGATLDQQIDDAALIGADRAGA